MAIMEASISMIKLPTIPLAIPPGMFSPLFMAIIALKVLGVGFVIN